LQTKLSNQTISDYAPTDSDANIVPLIQGTVVSESVETYHPRKRLNASQKLACFLLMIFAAVVVLLILLPWILKFALLLSLYLFIFIVSEGSYTIPTRGGCDGNANVSIPSTAVARRR
jgi:hypothetical protein